MTTDEAIQLGLQHHQAGRLAEAERFYRQALQQTPNHPDAIHFLGMIARRVGRFDVAEGLIRWAISIQPDSADYHSNLGLVLIDQKRFQEAIVAFRRAISLRPQFAQAICNLGTALSSLDQLDRSADAFRSAIQINPHFFEAYSNLAAVLGKQHHYAEAITTLKSALAINPNSDDLHYNLGNVLRESGQLAEAINSYHRAIELNPNHLEARRNLGNALRDQGKRLEAIDCYSQVIAIDPHHAGAHWNLSLTQLLIGDFERGLAEHEWRIKCESLSRPREFAEPRWQGEPLQGRTILLHPEQGLGDTLHFVRYAPLVARRGGTVVLECQPELHRLLSNLPSESQVIPRGQPLPKFDLQCPLMSLPFVLGTRLDSIPANVPYLSADPSLTETWKQKISSMHDCRRVGLVWSGSSTHKNDHNRSLPFEQLSPLSQLDDVHFFSLQKGEPAKKKSTTEFGRLLTDYTADLHDFADTAGLIANLDLIITVDTSVAHLAGGMGKPVWLLLPFDPDWRWLLDRDDSPWYPTMRLFRQRQAGNWNSVIAEVAERVGNAAASWENERN